MTTEPARPEHLRDDSTATALELAAPGTSGLVSGDLDDLFDTARRRTAGDEKPLAAPWETVNRALGGGLWPGMYCLVGGTGVGKTQWAVQLSLHAARSGARVLYLALELSRRDLAARIVGSVAKVPWSDLLYGRLDEAKLSEVVARSEQVVRALPLHVECAPPYGYAADTLDARAKALRPALVVLDYLQLCGGRAGEEPRLAVGRVSYVARALARDLNAVVLVLSSTARANYESLAHGSRRATDAKRAPSDFVGMGKESGEIEYAADGVFVLTHDPAKPNLCELVVAKHRHAALRDGIQLRWTGTEFQDPTRTRHSL